MKQIFLIPYNVVRSQNIDPLREPDVVDISGRKYFPAVKNALDNARESIFLVMYMVGLDERNTDSQVYKLCHSLADAKKRGIRVKVILDQNIDYTRERKEEEAVT